MLSNRKQKQMPSLQLFMIFSFLNIFLWFFFFREGFTQIIFHTDLNFHFSINCDKSNKISVQFKTYYWNRKLQLLVMFLV